MRRATRRDRVPSSAISTDIVRETCASVTRVIVEWTARSASNAQLTVTVMACAIWVRVRVIRGSSDGHVRSTCRARMTALATETVWLESASATAIGMVRIALEVAKPRIGVIRSRKGEARTAVVTEFATVVNARAILAGRVATARIK